MKRYKVSFEGKEGIFETTILARGRTEAENLAEKEITVRFFNNSEELYRFFYVLEDLETNKRMGMSVANCIAPPRR